MNNILRTSQLKVELVSTAGTHTSWLAATGRCPGSWASDAESSVLVLANVNTHDGAL